MQGSRSGRVRPPLPHMPRKAPMQRRVVLAGAMAPETFPCSELRFSSLRSGLKLLPFVGAGSLLFAHPLTAARFRRRTDAMIARLDDASVAEPSTKPVPAMIQSFARRAVGENPVPNTVWLRQCGEVRANIRGSWQPFTAEHVISIHEAGFAWLAA